MQTDFNTISNSLSIDVRICGNIPRNEMNGAFGAPANRQFMASRLNALSAAETNGSPTLHKISICDAGKKVLSDLILQRTDANNMNNQVLQNVIPFELVIPTWAVAGLGESELKPVCESAGIQSSVDLTKKRAVLFGRSPGCDVQLMHATSSRRHALVFHHSSGSCYVVDCGSAHGTFVNGKRVPSPSTTGVVLPHKVRRGSMIRFGGPGAPCFVLKAFATHTDDIACNADSEKLHVVRLNTRLNALGRVASVAPALSHENLSMNLKRSFGCFSSQNIQTIELESSSKRPRCSSPLMSPEQPIRLVSPDPPSVAASKPRRVTFSLEQPQSFYPVL